MATKANKRYKKDKSWSGRKTKKKWARLGKGASNKDKEIYKAVCEYLDELDSDQAIDMSALNALGYLFAKGLLRLN